jgi:hypothetical protein
MNMRTDWSVSTDAAMFQRTESMISPPFGCIGFYTLNRKGDDPARVKVVVA